VLLRGHLEGRDQGPHGGKDLSAEKELEKWKRKASSFFDDIRKIEEMHGVRRPVNVIIVWRKGYDSTTLFS
jgi:hypothetical protein